MIKIKLKSIFAITRTDGLRSRYFSDKDVFVDVEPGTHVEKFLQDLPFLGPPETYDDLMIHVFVNGKLMGFDYVLQPGDEIDIHVPVSGG